MNSIRNDDYGKRLLMERFNLDTPLMDFGNGIQWTMRNSVEGVFIAGSVGSGKSSGSAYHLAKKYLSHGYGGLVLTAKQTEKETFLSYCKEAGRLKDVICVEPGGKYFFNFLDYVASRAADQTAVTDNIVQVLKTVIRAGEEKDAGRSDDSFWENALDLLLYNVVDISYLAYGKIDLQTMYDIVQTILHSDEDVKTQDENKTDKAFLQAYKLALSSVRNQVKDWQDRLSIADREFYNSDQDLFETTIMDQLFDARTLKFVDRFFFESYKNLSEKTRSIVDFSFSSFLFRLLRDPVYSLFSSKNSNFSPEDCLDGKIIILNIPVKTYHKIGRDCQTLFKYIFQRSMEKRDIRTNERPVFIFADEAHCFIHEMDADFQATARSSRVATVYISQNLPQLFGAMGGQKSESKVKTFLGTLNTQIFHSNSCVDTNEWASKMIGQHLIIDESSSFNHSEKTSFGRSSSLKYEPIIRPEEFTKLKTGGKANNFKVEGIIHWPGAQGPKGKNYKKVIFNQQNF